MLYSNYALTDKTTVRLRDAASRAEAAKVRAEAKSGQGVVQVLTYQRFGAHEVLYKVEGRGRN